MSNGINDCGLFLLGVKNTATYPGDCTTFIDWQNWSQTFKAGLRDFSLASMDATQNWWFWTWKVGQVVPRAQHCLTSVQNLVFFTGRKLLYLGDGGGTPVVVPTWTAKWMDSD